MNYTETTAGRAQKILEGIREITQNEMLIRGQYISSLPNPSRRGETCRGFKACLIGAAYLAAGIKPDTDDFNEITPNERDDFLKRRAPLRLAIDALNAAARPRIKRVRNKDRLRHINTEYENSPAEGLFESATRLDRNLVLTLCNEAEELILTKNVYEQED